MVQEFGGEKNTYIFFFFFISQQGGGGGGSKLEMLAGVKSQMTGWLSGGIPGLGRGAAGPNEGDAPVSGEINDNEVARDSAQGATTDNVKDDDASRWVSGYVRSTLHATIHSSSYYCANEPFKRATIIL